VTIEQLEKEVLSLAPAERARLAQRLIASLDADDAIEQAWYDEAERRLAAMESGRLAEIPGNEVMVALGLEPLN
jgi:putative addiction module component (TIGR02574 family)